MVCKNDGFQSASSLPLEFQLLAPYAVAPNNRLKIALSKHVSFAEFDAMAMDLVIGYFRDHARGVLTICKAYTKGVKVGCAIDSGEEAGSRWFKSNVKGYMKTLIGAFKEIGAENVDEFMPPTPKSLAQKIWGFFRR
ncbi:hypothetical protein Tco_1077052 [Tanacetum coccineum]